MAQVAAEQIPVEVVRLVAVLALDDEPADADRRQQRLVDLQVGEIFEDVLALASGRARRCRPARSSSDPSSPASSAVGIGGIAGEGIDAARRAQVNGSPLGGIPRARDVDCVRAAIRRMPLPARPASRLVTLDRIARVTPAMAPDALTRIESVRWVHRSRGDSTVDLSPTDQVNPVDPSTLDRSIIRSANSPTSAWPITACRSR